MKIEMRGNNDLIHSIPFKYTLFITCSVFAQRTSISMASEGQTTDRDYHLMHHMNIQSLLHNDCRA